MGKPVHLVLLGPHTRVVADLCASCPLGPLGCCSTPPDLSWADIARIAALGGVDWLLAEIAAGRLSRGPRGLLVERVLTSPGEGPSGDKCVYHGEQGCSIPPERRSAACNYYVCADVLAAAGPDEPAVEAAQAAWTAQYQTWDEILSAEVGGWAGRAESPDDDRCLFEALAKRFAELT